MPPSGSAKIIGIGGFPHSEIVGSKVAHTSPTLIAACHVLHRLCMPRHPPNALTSRLRVHTTSKKAGPPVPTKRCSVGKPLGRPPHRSADDFMLSIDNRCDRHGRQIASRAEAPLPDPVLHATTASISRTHSQCQRRGQIPLPASRIRMSSSHGNHIAIPAPPRTRCAGRACARWWSLSGSNRRPQACKASALPTELRPRRRRRYACTPAPPKRWWAE